MNIFIVLDIVEIVSRPVLLEQVLVGNELCSLIRVGLNVTCIILDVALDPILILDVKSGLVMNNPIIFVILPILIIVVVGLLHFTGHVVSRCLIRVGISCIYARLVVDLTFRFFATHRILSQYLLLVGDDFCLSHALKIRVLLTPIVIYPVILFVLRFAG